MNKKMIILIGVAALTLSAVVTVGPSESKRIVGSRKTQKILLALQDGLFNIVMMASNF